jgi:hypothetical protein
VAIKVTFTPTSIFGIINGIGLGVTGSFNPSTKVLTTTTMASFAPTQIGFNFLVVVTTSSFRKLVATVIACTSENF